MKTRKTILISLLASVLILTFSLSSCVTIKLNSVKGSGDIATRTVDITGAERLIFSGLGEIIIEQGDKEELVIEAEENLLDYLRTDVSGNRLTIGLKRGVISIIPTKTPKFYLTLQNIEEVRLTGAGSILGEDLDVANLNIESSGLGSIDIEDIEAEEVSIEISGAGNIELTGNTEQQNIKISGLGSYKAMGLISESTSIEISGAGKATVYAEDSLDITLTGVGSVEYLGNPSLTQKVTGPGSIRQID